MAYPFTRAMKIVTWNVNSVRARLERLLAWLQKTQPDIVCLQELKAREEAFPYEAIREAGYHAAVSYPRILRFPYVCQTAPAFPHLTQHKHASPFLPGEGVALERAFR